MKKFQSYINGTWIDSSTGEIIVVDNPATEEIVGEVACASNEDVDLAVEAAKKSFLKRDLVDMHPMERSKLMRTIAIELRNISKEAGKLLCYENGKLLSGAEYEFQDAANYFDYYGGLTDKLEGSTIPVSKGVVDYTILEPYGVSAHIIPWNYPISMIGRSLACSIATGNSTVIKTPELAPLAAASYFAEALEKAGIPKGTVNIICGYGEKTGSYLVSHPDVNHIAFTGSVETGKKILHAAADKAIPAVVELGGKSAGIVYPDADLDKVVNSAKTAIFGVAGQICSAMSRLVVHKSVKDELVDKLVNLTKSLKVGPGYEKGIDCTPVISKNQLEKVEGYARSGIQAGAEAVAGGKKIEGKGYFFESTVLDGVKQDMTIGKEHHLLLINGLG